MFILHFLSYFASTRQMTNDPNASKAGKRLISTPRPSLNFAVRLSICAANILKINFWSDYDHMALAYTTHYYQTTFLLITSKNYSS